MSWSEIAVLAERAGEATLAGVDRGALPGFMRLLDDAALVAMAATLTAGGAFRSGAAQSVDQVAAVLAVAPRHRWILRRWLEILVSEGWLRHDAGAGRYHGLREASRGDVRTTAEAVDAARAGLGYPPAMTRFFAAAADHLPQLLGDEIMMQSLLFADHDLATAEAAYKDNVINSYLNAVTATVIAGLVDRHQGTSALRILELGAGVGGTTTDVLSAVRGKDVSYHFTDVSRYFLDTAAQRFTGCGVLTYGLVDINADLDADRDIDGAPVGSVDVVLAANVAHNAVDVGRFLRGVRRLLTPGGHVVLIESCREHYQVATSMQFLMSARPGTPPAGSADLRAGTDRIFVTREQWLEQLTVARLEPVLDLPRTDDPLAALGQHVFVAGR
ncbi:MAG: class I SAM-dependent methyltransferase [Phycicoccus sp.]